MLVVTTDITKKKVCTIMFEGVQYVYDPDADLFVKNAIISALDNDCFNDDSSLPLFLKNYKAWIQSSKLNTVKGLDKFIHASFSLGTTETFDKFYLEHRNKRFRWFRGEYMHHQYSNRNYKVIEDGALEENDVVVISLPFCQTGDKHPDMDNIIKKCETLRIPVLLDCAYFGLCGRLDFDFTSPAINTIAFSLSKTYPVSYLRIGIRFSRYRPGDTLEMLNRNGYVNRLGIAVGLQLFDHYTPDYLYNTYRTTQEQFCSKLNASPSPSVIFGISDSRVSSNIDESHRLCFSKYLKNGKLPIDKT